MDLLSPVYLTWALYLFYKKYRLKRSAAKGDVLRLSFWSLLGFIGALHWLLGGPRLILSGHEIGVTSLAFSPDGRFLASGSRDQTIKIWNPVTGENLKTLTIEDSGRKESAEAVAFSPDGKILAAGGRKIVSLWDTQSWTLRKNLRLDGVNPIESLIFFRQEHYWSPIAVRRVQFGMSIPEKEFWLKTNIWAPSLLSRRTVNFSPPCRADMA